MKRILCVTTVLLLLLAFGFGCSKREPPDGPASAVNGPPPDVLSATNLAQWRSLIVDLKPTPGLEDYWDTPRFRRGAPPVLLRHNGQSILFKAEAITVSTFHKTTNFMEAEIYSSKMNIDETRALGLSLCSMFGFDSNKFSGWCDKVGNNWLDAPSFNDGDHSHFARVLRSYNDEKPWYIIFGIEDENALTNLGRRNSR